MLDGISGLIRLTTTRHREGERVEGNVALVGHEGAIVWLDAD